jgi:hypothetical protein
VLSEAAAEPEAQAPLPAGDGTPRASIVEAGHIPESWHAEWDRLARHPSEINVFAERWFFEAGIAHFQPAGSVHAITIWRGDRLIGVMPARVERLYGRTRSPMSRTGSITRASSARRWSAKAKRSISGSPC